MDKLTSTHIFVLLLLAILITALLVTTNHLNFGAAEWAAFLSTLLGIGGTAVGALIKHERKGKAE